MRAFNFLYSWTKICWKYVENRKNSNARTFLNSEALKWYEARRLEKIIYGSKFCTKFRTFLKKTAPLHKFLAFFPFSKRRTILWWSFRANSPFFSRSKFFCLFSILTYIIFIIENFNLKYWSIICSEPFKYYFLV